MICLNLFANRYNYIPYYIGSLRFWWLVAASLVPVVEVPPWWLVSSWLVVASLVVLVAASLVPVVEVPPLVAGVLVAGGCLPGGAGGASLDPRPHIHSRTRGRGTRKAPQCGGALACESKLQGKFAGCDCSNYQLFRFSFRDGFYRLAFLLSL